MCMKMILNLEHKSSNPNNTIVPLKIIILCLSTWSTVMTHRTTETINAINAAAMANKQFVWVVIIRFFCTSVLAFLLFLIFSVKGWISPIFYIVTLCFRYLTI